MSNVRNIHFEAVGSYLRPAELKEARELVLLMARFLPPTFAP